MCEIEIVDLEIQARPPPFPEVRGECEKEKPAGVRELRMDWGDLGESQVSVRNKTSMERSWMISWSRACLSRS